MNLRKRGERVTLRTVAERVGVTAATVSYVLRGLDKQMHISPACVARVRAATAELGYRGHYHAQALSTGRARTIGLGVGSGPISILRSPFFSAISAGVEGEIRARGYDLLLVSGTDPMEPLERAFDHLARRRIDGLIVLRAIYPFPHRLDQLRQADFPAVLIEGDPENYAHHVGLDAAPGYAAAIAHLAQLGHRRLAWLAEEGPTAPTFIAARERCCREAAAAAGLSVITIGLRIVQSSRSGWRGGWLGDCRAAIAAALPSFGDTTAVLCQNDHVAIALTSEMAAHGISVPEQLSVVGFDDMLAEYSVPPLTTISHALLEMGQAAVRIVTDCIEGRLAPDQAIQRVPSFLVARGSTGPAAPRT